MKKRIAAVVLAVLLAAVTAFPALAAQESGTVLIAAGGPDESGQMCFRRGTGFFVGAAGEDPVYLVTGAQVLEDFTAAGKALGGGELYVLFDQDSKAEAFLVACDEESDLAILRLAESTDRRVPLPLRTAVELRTEVRAVYYPPAADATEQSVLQTEDAVTATGHISAISEIFSDGALLQTDLSIAGTSGPLLDSSGAVIGVQTWPAPDGSEEGRLWAVSVGALLPLLEENSVPYTLATDAAAPAGDHNMIFYAATAGGAGVLLLVGLLVLSSKGRKAGKAEKQAAKEEQKLQKQLAKQQKQQEKRQKQQKPPKQQKNPPPPPRQPQPVLRSVAPQHGGMTVSLQYEPVQVGRDSSICRLCYQDGTPGVSSRHCQVWFDQGAFFLMDVGSTYGTYLSDGQRLTPNTPVQLAPGAAFYLGEAANTVYVDVM